jgi:hypothetical protein
MKPNSTKQKATRKGSRPASAEQRLKELGIKLSSPPEPFGTYVEAVQTGNLLFLSGMLPTVDRPMCAHFSVGLIFLSHNSWSSATQLSPGVTGSSGTSRSCRYLGPEERLPPSIKELN